MSDEADIPARKSHLDIESPLFHGKPHLWIQWKGTDVCCDVHCVCGALLHFDGEFFYFFECGACGRLFESGTHVAIYEVEKDDPRLENVTVNFVADDEEDDKEEDD